MFLRALTVKGFKSFAEPTTLELTPGLTAVVGPNGSGKSNIVDAVAWVLGAQSAKNLRSSRMDDVVFAGNGRRGPLGRAEVSLTIDNTAGLLPIDFSEVTVTRTLFRSSGESTYAINGVPCRLLDVTDLLSDAGVGRQQHVIVSQGHLASVLEAKPEERRLVVEEAAGILKFRRRKEKAQRRLVSTEANIERLSDLVREVRRQMRPLERQAEAARRHQELTTSLEAVRLHLLGRRLARFRAQQAAAAAEQAELAAGEVRLTGELRELDGEIASLEAVLARDDGAWLSQAAGRIQALQERGRGMAALLDERAGSLARLLEDARGADAVATLEGDAARLAAELVEVERARAALSSAELAQDSAEAELAEDQDRLAVLSEADYAARQLSEARGELTALRAALGQRRHQLDQLDRARLGAEGERGAAADRLEVARARLQEAAGQAEAHRATETEARSAVDEAAVQLGAAEAEMSRLRGEEGSRRGRLEVLSDQLEARAGQDVPGALGTLLACVAIETGWELAVEAAVAPSLDALVVTDAASAQGVLASVEEMAVVVASLQAQGSTGGDPSELRRRVEPAATLAPAEASAVAGLLDRLLDGIEVVDSRAEAAARAERDPGVVVVTTDGARFAPECWQVRSSRRSLAAALADARQSLDEASTRAAAAAADVAGARSRLAGLQEHLDRCRARLQEATRSEAELATAVARAEADQARAAGEVASLEGRRVQLSDHDRADRARVAELEELLASARSGEGDLRPEPSGDQLFTDLRQARHDLAQRAGELATRRAELAARQAELAERQTQLERQLATLEQRLLRLRGEATIAEARSAEQERVLGHTRRLADHLARHLDAAASWAEELEQRRHRFVALRRERSQSLDRLRHHRTEAETERERIRHRQARAEVAHAEAGMRLESTLENLRSELAVDPETAMAAECPPLPEGVTAAQRLRELEGEIRSLGPVNPLATEELAALVERHDFLTAQLDDVKRSRRELAKVIRAVDEEMTTRLAAAVADVVDNFSALFETLFPGGTGRLVVTDPDNLLESGLEIEARPGGKRPRKLSLLSGGERSLCALAFHFAVFRSRPSPFYLLDEVEAALDDVNLQRFIRLLDEFRESSQLVVVTHQKRTMEAADSLYGVTMAPGGTSRVISERLRPEVSAAVGS